MKVDVKEYEKFYDRLGLKEHPLAVFYSDEEPAHGIRPKIGTGVYFGSPQTGASSWGNSLF